MTILSKLLLAAIISFNLRAHTVLHINDWRKEECKSRKLCRVGFVDRACFGELDCKMRDYDSGGTVTCSKNTNPVVYGCDPKGYFDCDTDILKNLKHHPDCLKEKKQ